MVRLAALLGTVVLLASTAPAATGRSSGVPILMYHVVAAAPIGARFPDLYVARSEFSAQMAWLASHGYRAVTLRRLYEAWHGRARLPKRPIVVSFDDGYRSQYVNARPVLARRGWPGVLNLDVSNLREAWGLSPRMVRALIAAGWEVDAHSMTHPDLRRLSDAALQREVEGSREAIRRLFRVPVDFFCYPAGLYDERVVATVRRVGFLGATTVDHGLARPSEPFTLERIRVDGGDGVAGLARKLARLDHG